LLLAHLIVNPKSVLLLDEPDAHLETLRQRQTYQLLVDAARESNSQIIAASHSEVVLNEAADRDVVVAFLGKPHRIDDRGNQLLKSLREIGFDHYYQAEQRGWILYLEGSSDLANLTEWSRILKHEAQSVLESPFVHYVGNDRMKAISHFHGLREAMSNLAAFALFDRGKDLPQHKGLTMYMWKRREIENYLCTRETLLTWAREGAAGSPAPLFGPHWSAVMEESIREIEVALGTLGRPSPWSSDAKVSDDFLAPVFKAFYSKLQLPNLMEKSNYHQLARFVPVGEIDPEVRVVLDLIVETARKAQPV
jgi:putative AbiEii toxin of type IV toxin-antitoxin system